MPQSVEVLFYHLERTTLETVLPGLLEKSLERDWKALVMIGTPEKRDALDTHLWTFRDDSFLPHGHINGSTGNENDPVILALPNDDCAASPPNGAGILFLVDGADLALTAMENYHRCVVIFDGRDDDALIQARTLWKDIKSVGAPFEPTYWQQGDQGRWEKKA